MRLFQATAAGIVLAVVTVAAAQDRFGPPGPAIAGAWYLSGDQDKQTYVERSRWEEWRWFTNERGEGAWGRISRDRIRIPSWDDEATGGLFGQVRGDTILWSNGTYWTRRAIFAER